MTKTYKRKNRTDAIADMLPVIILLILLPVLTKAAKIRILVSNQIWYPGGETGYDFFMFWKGRLLIILVLWMLFMLLDRILIRRIKVEGLRAFLPMGIYGLLAVLSSVLSVNKGLSTYGMIEQYETIWVLLGYVIVAFYSYQIADDNTKVQMLLGAGCVGAGLQVLIGLSQYAGMDFWNGPGKWLITLGNESHLREDLRFVFADSGVNLVYMGSGNPNYAGVYIVTILPVVVGLGMSLQKKWQRICCFVLGALLVLCLIGTGSKTGMILTAGMIFATVCIMTWKRKKWMIPTCLLAIIFGFFVYDQVNEHVLIRKMSNAVHYVKEYKWQEAEPEADGVTIKFQGRELFLQGIHEQNNDKLLVLENHETPLRTKWNEKKQAFFINDPDFYNMCFNTFVKDGAQYLQIGWNKGIMTFMKATEADAYTYVNPAGKIDDIIEAKTLLPGFEKSFSSRGYIWGRTLLLLKQSIIWGTGPDTFSVVFPQQDYLMRVNTSSRLQSELLTKPHSLYLQIALQTGILSLLAVLWTLGTGIVVHLKALKGKTMNWLSYGMFLSCVGFLLMGIMNDSVVATTPVFCTVFGISMRYVKTEKTVQ